VPTAMKVMIVDDEPAARRTLREFCARETDLLIVGEYGDARAALDAIGATTPDLIFLDMQLGSSNGLALARSLNPDHLPIIVFVTAYDRYAIDAFEVNATDYLLKPFDAERFYKTMVRVRRRWQAGPDSPAPARSETAAGTLADPHPRLLAESNGHLRLLDVADIELTEGDRNYVQLTVGQEVFHARCTLQQAQKALQTQPILRISRSCLINVNHVREVGRTPRGDFIFVLAGGATVTSSEGFRDAVRSYLARFKVGAP